MCIKEMIKRIKVTPKLDVKTWVESEINKNWFQFQYEIALLGDEVLKYMHGFISTHKKRPKIKHTGEIKSLEDAITLDTFPPMAQVGWGIGDISKLKTIAPHWYVTNVGGMIPGGGKLVPPGSFAPGTPEPNANSFRAGNWEQGMASDGKMFSFRAKRPTEPINYIENSQTFFRFRLQKILDKLRRSK